jgi:Luciferase-like monooxygenase
MIACPRVPNGKSRSLGEDRSKGCRAGRGARLSQHPVPIGLSGRASHAVFRCRLRPITDRINFRVAIRCGAVRPVILARTVATPDHMLKRRLMVNVISFDFLGGVADSACRFKRSHEVVEDIRQASTHDHIDYEGEACKISKVSTDPARPTRKTAARRCLAETTPPMRRNCVARRAPCVVFGPNPWTCWPIGCATLSLGRLTMPNMWSANWKKNAAPDSDRAGTVGLRRVAGRIGGSGAAPDRGQSEDGHSRLHIPKLSASG